MSTVRKELEKPAVEGQIRLQLSAEMEARIHMLVEQTVEAKLEDLVRKYMKEVLEEAPKRFDVETLREKMKTEELSPQELEFLQKEILKSLSDQLRKLGEEKYVAISLDGEIISLADDNLALLTKIDRIDYPAKKIFLHKTGSKAYAGWT